MSYAQSLLAKDEQILYRGRQHWLAPISDSLKPFVLILVGLVLLFAEMKVSPDGTVSSVWLGISVIVLLIGVMVAGDAETLVVHGPVRLVASSNFPLPNQLKTRSALRESR